MKKKKYTETSNYKASLKYQREKQTIIKGSFKNEFANKFKEACKKLGIPQRQVIEKAMNNIIEKANKL